MVRVGDGPNMYAHPVCYLWTPEYCTPRPGEMVNLEELRAREPARAKLACKFCEEGGGAVQCMRGDCMRSAHPYCAQNATPSHLRWLLRTKAPRCEDDGIDVKCEFFCDECLDIAIQAETSSAAANFEYVRERARSCLGHACSRP
jgi:hypothetical protein